jgi:FHS family L-fucose permease-like MFS transporter
MSIMYPTHFALGIRGLGEKTKLAASWMVTAVVGGAILPYFMGLIADKYSMRAGFLMPLGCFAFIAFYGFSWRKFYRHDLEN